ncbi:MAG: hypothetical protein ACE5OZ_11530, partial [Candidatus Heimdallarchaeota archaeon]
MRFRMGFVSNSSSTSFVLAVPRDFDLSTPLPLPSKLHLAQEDHACIRTEKHLEKYTDWKPSLYQQAIKAVRSGQVVLVGKLNSDYSDEYCLEPCAAENGFGNLSHYGIDVIQDCKKPLEEESEYVFAMGKELYSTTWEPYSTFPITVMFTVTSNPEKLGHVRTHGTN